MRAILSFVLAAGFAVAALLVPRGHDLISKGPPNWNPPDLLTLAFAAAAALCLAVPIALRDGPPFALSARVRPWIAAIIGLCIAGALLCGVWIEAFKWLLWEDSIGQYLQAIFLLGGFFALAATLVAAPPRREGGPLQLVLLGVLALGLFVAGMEELSWLQRAFGLATPEWLLTLNTQRELNFHNIETWGSETVSYVAGSLALVATRVVLVLPAGWPLRRWLEPMLPGAISFTFGAIATAVNFDMWRIVFIELAFAVAIAVALAEAVAARRNGDRQAGWLFAALAAGVLVVQVIFFFFGSLGIGSVTEAHESLLSFGLGIYAVEQAQRLRRERREAEWKPVNSA